MGFSLGGHGRTNYNVKGSLENEQITKNASTGEIKSLNVQTAATRNQGLFGHYNLGWDYDINEKNSMAASVRFGLRGGKNYQDDLQQFTNGTLVNFQDIASKDISNNVDISLTYTHLYTKPQRELSFQGLYSRNNRDNSFENFFYNTIDFSTSRRFKNLNDSHNQEMTFQVDYQTPIRDNQMLEFGGKDILRKAISDFTSFDATGSDGPYIPSTNTNYSNNLNYDQNVMASYLSYTYTTKAGYSFKAGSRYEYTMITAYTKTENNIEIPSYGVIVPSINVSKKLKGGNMVKAAYNRRIQRPSIRFLNPNIQRSNNLNFTVGNPELSPEYTNNYELSYSTFIKGTTLNFSPFYRNTNDAIQSVRDYVELDGEQVIRTTYQNIGHENAYGASVFANVTVGKLSLNGGGDFYYASVDNKNPVDSLHFKNEGLVASGRIFGSYDLGKNWGFQFFSFVRGNQVQLQGSQGGFYMYSLAIRKQFNEKRGSIGIGAENFLQPSIKIKTNLESPALNQKSIVTLNNMSFRVTFSYRIGKMTMENRPRRPRKSINNDDLKDGDGGGDGANNMGDGGQQQRGGTSGTFTGGGQRQNAPVQTNTKPATQNNIAKPADEKIYEAAGTWTYTIDSPQGGTGVIVIKKDEGGVYSGTIKTSRMKEETVLTAVTVNGNGVSFSYPVSFGGNTSTAEVKTIINNNDMSGTMSIGQFRTFNLTGKRSN